MGPHFTDEQTGLSLIETSPQPQAETGGAGSKAGAAVWWQPQHTGSVFRSASQKGAECPWRWEAGGTSSLHRESCCRDQPAKDTVRDAASRTPSVAL